MIAHVYAPKRSDVVKIKSLNSSRICIIKRDKHHSSIMEVWKFKKIRRIVPHVPCNSDRRRLHVLDCIRRAVVVRRVFKTSCHDAQVFYWHALFFSFVSL
jgi:hypothetical protein